jgi:hypothetical protein
VIQKCVVFKPINLTMDYIKKSMKL